MFMVLDLMLGGDLRFHLDRNGNMREEIVRFYMAELALALDYLHSIQIVHRDLKPDNVLLDEKGHAHITDFNIAVHFSPRRALTSIAGSMAYMAPEVLAKRGYLASVDWWSLGVMAYELLFGRRPFRGKTNSALTHSILHDKCVFPDNVGKMVSPGAVSFVSGLLERDVKKRLGCRAGAGGGMAEFKAHPFFAGLDWEAVESKTATPPFEPDSKKANFDATHELEELLLEDNPLKARKRKEDVDINALSPELRLMEQHFLPFDHVKQQRRSYFKTPRATLNPNAHAHDSHEVGTVSQISSANGFGLVDQPLAETHAHPPPASTASASASMHRQGSQGNHSSSAQHHPPDPSNHNHAAASHHQQHQQQIPPLPSAPSSSSTAPLSRSGTGQSIPQQQQQQHLSPSSLTTASALPPHMQQEAQIGGAGAGAGSGSGSGGSPTLNHPYGNGHNFAGIGAGAGAASSSSGSASSSPPPPLSHYPPGIDKGGSAGGAAAGGAARLNGNGHGTGHDEDGDEDDDGRYGAYAQ